MHRPSVRRLATFGVLLALAPLVACGSGQAASTTSAAASHPRCARGTAAPISLRAPKRALAAAGYQTSLDRSLCVRSGPGANQGGLTFSEWTFFCEVEMRSPPRQTIRPATRFEGPNYSGKAYVVAYENVDCWVYQTGSRREKIVAALRRMFATFGAHHVLVQTPQA